MPFFRLVCYLLLFIIKLGKICSYTEGYVNPEISNEKYFSAIGMPWLKVANLIHGSNIYSTKHYLSKLGQSLAKNDTQLFKKETIVWSKSGSIGLTSILKIDVMANRGVLNIKPNDKYIKNKYLFYFLCKNKNIYSSKGTGAVLKHFYGPNLMNEKINLPSIKTQDSVIGIIEPFEILENKILNLLKYIQNLFLSRNLEINNFIKESISWKSNGYPYKDPDKDILGLYKIFTIKNINDNTKFLKTNIMKNNLISIGDIITGLSGTIGTTSVVCENDWVSNQRTLVLRSKLPLNIKISIEKQNDLLMHYATGAVQKNITSDNILNLKMIEKNINDEYINQFYIILLILKNKIIKIKKYAINLLID